LALPPGELPLQAAERVNGQRSALSVFAARSHLSQGERQEGR